jgi:hypothetical protein
MRKFLMVVAIGALALAVAAPAMALDFKFGGEWRVRWTTGVNVGPNVTVGGAGTNVPSAVVSRNPFQEEIDGSNPRSVQIRIRPLITISDDNGNIQAVWRGEIGDITWGTGGGANAGPGGNTNIPAANDASSSARVANGGGGELGGDGVNLETKWVYTDAAFPFGVPLRARAGLQWWLLPKSLLVDEDVFGVRLYGQAKPVSYEAFWFRPKEGSTFRDDAYDFYGGRADVAVAPFFNPGVYYIYGRNAAVLPAGVADNPLSSHYIGFTMTGKAGIVAYDLDFIYGTAEGGVAGTFGNAALGAVKTKGWTVDAAVHFPVGPVTINFAGSYATGDKADGGDSEAFPTIAPSWNGAGGGFEMIGSGGAFDQIEYTQDAPTNLWMVGGWVTYTPVKPLVLKVAYGYAGFVKKAGNCQVAAGANLCYGPSYPKLAGKSNLGQELSLRADYTIWTGFKLQGQLGWLFPSTGDVAAEYVLQMLYNF